MALFVLPGCAAYHPKPLDEQAVSERLKSPVTETIRIEALEIKHPILKPQTIDFKKGISAADAAIIAVIANPSLRTERDRRGIAGAQLLQAGILPNPAFTYSMDFPTGGATRGTVNGYGLTLDWTINSLFTRGARVDSARAAATSVDLEVAWKEWQVAESAKLHVYRLAFLEKQLSVADDEVTRLQQNLKAIKKAVSLGDMTALDQEAAGAAFRSARTSFLDIARQLEQERLAVNRILGFPPKYNILLKKDMSLPAPEKLPPLKVILKGLEERRLDLLALRMGYQSQEARLRAAVLGQFPAIDIGPTHLRDTGDVVTTGFTASISLPFFDLNQGHIAIEKATRQRLFDEYMDRVFQARSGAARILADMRDLEKQIDAAQDTVKLLKKLVDSSYNGFLEGNIDALTYYNELNRLFTKKLDLLKLQQNLADSVVALEITSGEHLGQMEEKGAATK
jgi:outer membrane protein TolC